MGKNADKVMVFGYVRVSTTGQVKEGYSLEQQKEEITSFCKDNGYELVKIEGLAQRLMNSDGLTVSMKPEYLTD